MPELMYEAKRELWLSRQMPTNVWAYITSVDRRWQKFV